MSFCNVPFYTAVLRQESWGHRTVGAWRVLWSFPSPPTPPKQFPTAVAQESSPIPPGSSVPGLCPLTAGQSSPGCRLCPLPLCWHWAPPSRAQPIPCPADPHQHCSDPLSLLLSVPMAGARPGSFLSVCYFFSFSYLMDLQHYCTFILETENTRPYFC